MSTAGLLSATPARMARDDSLVIISSSPEFPSICDLLPKAPTRAPLRSGSNAAPIPGDAPKAFKSAASIWRTSHRDDEVEFGDSRPQPPMKPTSAMPPAIPAIELSPEPATERLSHGLGVEKAKPRPQTTRRKNDAQAPSRNATDEPMPDAQPADAPPAKKPERKARAAKDTAKTQTMLPKGKVTKPAPKEAKPKKKPETISRHFAPPDPAPGPAAKPLLAPIEEELLVLEPAMMRRMDWTPPRESALPPRVTKSSSMKELPSSAAAAEEGVSTEDVFRNLQDAYGRKEDNSFQASNPLLPSAHADILGKRKLVEMVAAGNKQKTPEASPTKPKAPKKKPRTITELATAAYRLPEDDVSAPTDGPRQDSLLGYLGPADEQTTAGIKDSRPKAKGSKRLTKPKPLKKKKEVARKPILLSPTSAMRQVARQDFVFGTASQLATEDDPELLRALHEAMKISNQEDDDPFSSPALNSDLAIRKRPGARLWAAGARYDDGELLDLEALDLTRSSPQLQKYLLPDNSSAREKVAVHRPPSQRDFIEIQSDDTFDIGDFPALTGPKDFSRPRPSQEVQPAEDSSPSMHEDQPSDSVSLPDFEPPPSNQEQHQIIQSQSSSPLRPQVEAPPRPKFDLYTDARLSKEVAAFGFKAVKKRTAMIALLDQCWAGQNKTVLGSTTTHASMSTSTKHPASPARPRGRPRKDSTASASDVVKAPAAGQRVRKKSVSTAEAETEAPEVVKRPRGRPRKDAAAPPKKPAKARTAASPKRAKSPAKAKAPASTKRTASPSKAKAPASPKRARSPAKSAVPAPATPKKRRKAPSKSVVEIADSDSDDSFASSPISSPGQQEMFSSPPQMDLSVTEDNETSLIASPTNQQVALFGYITQAVISAPRSKDPMDPSWHEKMLMYDPVILEDLAAWLNSGQLDRVGYDKEVSPGDVKKWCEDKSVCCLWRVNLRGKERKRF